VHLLAFVGGFIDSAGYLWLNGVFTSSITGNLVVAASSVTNSHGVLCRSLTCVSFFGAGVLAAALALRARLAHSLSRKAVCCALFAAEVALFVAVWVLGNRFDQLLLPNKNIDLPQSILLACLLGAAMGFQNVAAKEQIANCPPTTVMTSTLINVAQHLSNALEFWLASHGLLRLQPSGAAAARLSDEQAKAFGAKFDDSLHKFATAAKPLVCFTLGCIIGALTVKGGSWHCLAIPVAIVLAVMLDGLLLSRPAAGGDAAAQPQAKAVEAPQRV